MDKAEFEKRFLALVYQTNTVITAPNVAYHLSIPIEEAQEQLIAMELNGTIQQATDPQGATYYTMPNRPPPGTMPAGQPGTTGAPPGVYDPANLPSMPMYNSPAAKGMSVNGLVLNVMVPGLGSVVNGKMIGVAMMLLALFGLILFFLPLGFGRLLGFLPIVAAWVWSIIAGVQLLNNKEAGPGVPA